MGNDTFYEKLAAAKRSQDEDGGAGKLVGGLKGALGGTMLGSVGSGLGAGLSLAAMKREMRRDGDNSEALRAAIQSKRHLRAGAKPVYLSPAGAGPKGNAFFGPDIMGHRQLQRLLKDPAYTREVHDAHRGVISGALTRNHTILAHELGHATGSGNQPALHIGRGVSNLAHNALGLGSYYSGYRAGTARTQEEIDSARRLNRRLSAAQLATALPTLAEEARASIRAHGLSKKLTGQGVNKKLLAAAYGTYLSGGVLPTLITNRVNESLLRQREKQLQERARGRG